MTRTLENPHEQRGALRRRARGLFWAVVALVVWLPAAAGACPVCSAGLEDENRKAFINTTAFMTFLPLLILGGTVWWFVRRALERERHDEAMRVQAGERPRSPSPVELAR